MPTYTAAILQAGPRPEGGPAWEMRAVQGMAENFKAPCPIYRREGSEEVIGQIHELRMSEAGRLHATIELEKDLGYYDAWDVLPVYLAVRFQRMNEGFKRVTAGWLAARGMARGAMPLAVSRDDWRVVLAPLPKPPRPRYADLVRNIEEAMQPGPASAGPGTEQGEE